MQVTHILLRIEHTKPLPDLLDLAAGRVYTLSGVSDVTAGLVEDREGIPACNRCSTPKACIFHGSCLHDFYPSKPKEIQK